MHVGLCMVVSNVQLLLNLNNLVKVVCQIGMIKCTIFAKYLHNTRCIRNLTRAVLVGSL